MQARHRQMSNPPPVFVSYGKKGGSIKRYCLHVRQVRVEPLKIRPLIEIDLLQMKKSNVINGAIEYVPRKTKEGRPITVRVPLGPTALEILERYPDVPGNRLLPFTCAQDYNRNIKKMLRLAGIDRQVTVINSLTREEEQHPIREVASSHMARRVLVGNLYKELKDPNLIAKISGHVENSKAFNRYRNIDEEMAKEVIMKLE